MLKAHSIAVIGGGAAGTMAALRGILNNDEVFFFPGSPKDTKRSRHLWVKKIENMPDYFKYKRGIVEPNQETISWIKQSQFKDNFHEFKNTGIVKVEKIDGGFKLIDSRDNQHLCEYIVLCTGVMDKQPVIGGSIEAIFPYANKQTADYCLRCDGHHVLNKHTSVIGHESGAAWVAVMLYERYRTPSMTVLSHGQKSDFSDEVKQLLKKYKIKTIEHEIVEVLGDPKLGKLEGYKFANNETFSTEFSFISLGMIVYNQLAKDLGANLDDRGFVVTDQKGLSSVENLYVAGDLRAGIKKQVYTAWDSAVDSLDAINSKIRLNKRSF